MRAEAIDLRRMLYGNRLLELFVAPHAAEKLIVLGVCAAMLAGVWLLVWQTAIYVYVHLAYLPIAIAALIFGGWGGLIAGAAAGLLVGPLVAHDPAIPLISEEWLRFDTTGWTFRLAAFAAFGAAAGTVLSILRRMTVKSLEHGYKDELTGLPNHQYMSRVLNTLTVAGGSTAVYAVSVHMYRRTITAFGTEVGEALVKGMAERLKEIIPDTSLLFRVYEGRFGIIVPFDDAATLEERAEAVLNYPIDAGGLRLLPRATLGKCLCYSGDCDPGGAIRRAVLAADQGELARETLHVYEPDKDESQQDQIRLLSDFNTALETDQLYLAYQPKVDLKSGRVVGCEALVRWRHPERGDIPPSTFIPVVEQSGLIHELTIAVLKAAVGQAAEWDREGARLTVSVNVSAHDLVHAGFVDHVTRIIDDAGIGCETIDLEVTESAAFQDNPTVHQNLTRIRDAGINLSIDDYGTGMSSLYYLREIPATTLKIDQLFIRSLLGNPVDVLLVKSTIELCRSLGIATVGEGIEDKETADLLAGMGCEIGQGYHFARPLPPDQLLEHYRRNGS